MNSLPKKPISISNRKIHVPNLERKRFTEAAKFGPTQRHSWVLVGVPREGTQQDALIVLILRPTGAFTTSIPIYPMDSIYWGPCDHLWGNLLDPPHVFSPTLFGMAIDASGVS